jgi:uncharacterized membrane protein
MTAEEVSKNAVAALFETSEVASLRATTPTRLECCAPGRRLASVGLAYTPAALLALVMPKCPLCLAALLAMFGVTGVVPGYSYALVVLVGVALGTLALGASILYRLRRRSCSAGPSLRDCSGRLS